MKARVFVDFWNFQLTLNDAVRRNFSVDWKQLPVWLVSEASTLTGDALTYEGAKIYMSYDPRNPKDKGLKGWATNTVDRFPGVDVFLRERKRRGAPVCQGCHKKIDDCPHCGVQLSRTIEKGIDTAIVTDLVASAWSGTMDIAILVTADRDFIPAVELLNTKGIRTILAHFPPLGADLSRTCWASIDLKNGKDNYKR